MGTNPNDVTRRREDSRTGKKTTAFVEERSTVLDSMSRARSGARDGMNGTNGRAPSRGQIFIRARLDGDVSGRSRVVARDVVHGRTTAREVIESVTSSRALVVTCALVGRRRDGSRATYRDEDALDADACSTAFAYDVVDGKACRVGLAGGGGDGGATGAESRSAYLEMYAWNGGTTFSRKKESLGGFVRYSTQSTVRDRDEAEEDLARWFTCALTEEPLETCENGVVIDRTGALYNKQPVLEALRNKAVDGAPLPKRIEHVTGMKALVTCQFHKRRRDAGDGEDGTKAKSVNARNFRCGATDAVFSCPITGLDFNGKTKFVVVRPSGVVVADKALREAKVSVEDMNDGVKLTDAPPPIPVNPRGEELELLKSILEEEKKKKERKKKSKKDASGETKRKTTGDASGGGDVESAAKRAKPTANAPDKADESVYASIFTSSADLKDANADNHFLARNARKAW
jgi:hypothetical protein